MLWGKIEEVEEKIVNSLFPALFYTWDVLGKGEAVVEAQGRLRDYGIAGVKVAIEEGIIQTGTTFLPLHGKFEEKKVVSYLVNWVAANYSMISPHDFPAAKRKKLATAFRANLGAAFCGVPRNQAELARKYPELFPPKRKKKVSPKPK